MSGSPAPEARVGTSRYPWWLLGASLPIESCLLFLVLSGDLRHRPVRFLVAYFLTFAGYVAALWAGRRLSGGPRAVYWIAGIGLLFRLTLLPAEPSLSDDIYRYLWDGRVQAAGINPYLYAPADPELAPLRDEQWERINHREIPTIYPPAMQALFAVAAPFAPTALGFKLVLVLFDLGTLGLLWRLLIQLKVDVRNLIIYAWNPLVLLEVAGNGHNDVVAVMFLTAALLWIIQKRTLLSTLGLGMAILSKLFPICALPSFVRRTRAAHLWLLPLMIVVGFLPFLDAGSRLFGGLLAYGKRWQHNDLLFRGILAAIRRLDPAEGLKDAITRLRSLLGHTEAISFLYEYTDPQFIARAIVLLLVLGIGLYVSFRRWGPTLEALGVLSAALLLSPTVHPWYLLWVVPLLALHPSRALILWTGLAPLSYVLGVLDPAGRPPGGLLLYAEYVPVYLLLVLEMVWAARRARIDAGRGGLLLKGLIV